MRGADGAVACSAKYRLADLEEKGQVGRWASYVGAVNSSRESRSPGLDEGARLGANAAERTPCANRVGALGKSIRSYAENPRAHVVEPQLGLTFDSLGEAGRREHSILPL